MEVHETAASENRSIGLEADDGRRKWTDCKAYAALLD